MISIHLIARAPGLIAVALASTMLLPITAQALTVNQPAPACLLNTLTDSQTHRLQQFKNKVVYVDFWASWCGPCAQSFPFMNELHRQHQSQGLQILAVNMDESADDAKQFLSQRPADFMIVADSSQQCAKEFGVEAMPSTYLIDRKGNLRYIHKGFRPGEVDELRNTLQQLLNEPES